MKSRRARGKFHCEATTWIKVRAILHSTKTTLFCSLSIYALSETIPPGKQYILRLSFDAIQHAHLIQSPFLCSATATWYHPMLRANVVTKQSREAEKVLPVAATTFSFSFISPVYCCTSHPLFIAILLFVAEYESSKKAKNVQRLILTTKCQTWCSRPISPPIPLCGASHFRSNDVSPIVVWCTCKDREASRQ